jgi:hypothetical protein
MRVAIGLILLSIVLRGPGEGRLTGASRGDVGSAVQTTDAATSWHSVHESFQSLDSLTTLMETHGSLAYEIRPDHNRAQKVVQTLTAARLETCVLSWSVTSVSAHTSRISLTSDLRVLAADKTTIGEMRGRNAFIHISFVPSLWELEVPIVEGSGSNVHSKNLDTGIDTSLPSLYLMLNSEDGAKQVANALRLEIERCRKSSAS